MSTKKTKRVDSAQFTKGPAERTEDMKQSKQTGSAREQRKHDKQLKLSEKYQDEATDAEEILSVATISNEDRNEDDDDGASDVSEADSFCRHCLRPQSELQLRYMRPRQHSKLRQQQQAKRERSQQRFSSYYVGSGNGMANMSAAGHQTPKNRLKKSRSKSRSKRSRNNKYPSSSSNSNNHKSNNCKKEQHLKLPLIRDLNAANEQAIRFRCPQVGPQVGRDRQMPPLLHFHHPRHVQKQLTAYQVQYTHFYGQQQQRFASQQVISPVQTTILTMESELKQQQQLQQHQPQYQHHHHHFHHQHNHHHHFCHQHNEHLSGNQKSNKHQQEPQQYKSFGRDLTAATNNNLQNCCSTVQQESQQTTHYQCPQCNSNYRQQTTCCNSGTTLAMASCCSCSLNNILPTTIATAAATTQNYHHQDQPRYSQHQQYHNLPQLPLTHPEASSATAVASLDAATLLAATSAAHTNTNTDTTLPQQVLAPLTLTLLDEHRNQNLNNPTTAEEDPSNLAAATTPDSPSLVKVSTWYTVAKQGVSC